jgi:hypothetical protein
VQVKNDVTGEIEMEYKACHAGIVIINNVDNPLDSYQGAFGTLERLGVLIVKLPNELAEMMKDNAVIAAEVMKAGEGLKSKTE